MARFSAPLLMAAGGRARLHAEEWLYSLAQDHLWLFRRLVVWAARFCYHLSTRRKDIAGAHAFTFVSTHKNARNHLLACLMGAALTAIAALSCTLVRAFQLLIAKRFALHLRQIVRVCAGDVLRVLAYWHALFLHA